MDSMPPATPSSRSPARIAASSMPTARTPDAQTLLMVSEETSLGIPALICAWREGIWPWPAWSSWPITTWSTWSGLISARSRAAAIALPPRSVASSDFSPPPSFPTGVRAADRITVLGITASLSCGSGGSGPILVRGAVRRTALEDPARGRRGVDLARHNPVQQLPDLGILLHRGLELPAHVVGRQR